MRRTKIHTMPCAFPVSTMNKLKYIAEYNGRSANKEIEQLILRHIADYEKEHGPIPSDEQRTD